MRTAQVSAEDAKSVRQRRAVSELVMAGDVDGALAATEAAAPGALAHRPALLFRMHVQAFIEHVSPISPQPRTCSPASKARESSSLPPGRLLASHQPTLKAAEAALLRYPEGGQLWQFGCVLQPLCKPAHLKQMLQHDAQAEHPGCRQI